MILPSTYIFSLVVLVLSALCWGSWATTYKATGHKWRYELYYYDFAIGAVIAALIAALTFGSMGWDGFSFIDDVRNAGKRQDLWAFLAGCVFNLGNMLMVGSISISGMVVAFPISLGIALTIGTLWNHFSTGNDNLLLVATGCLCLLAAAAVSGMAFKTHMLNRLLLLVQQGKTKSTKKSFNAKSIFLACVAGVLLGCYSPLVELAKESEIGLGPYGLAFVFAAGILFSSFVFNLFFMNLPIAGKVVDFGEYFKGGAKTHLLGVFGGMLFSTGLVCSLIASRVEGEAALNPTLVATVGKAAALIAALWGLIVWKEYDGADARVKTLVSAMLVLFLVGILLIAVSPVYVAK